MPRVLRVLFAGLLLSALLWLGRSLQREIQPPPAPSPPRAATPVPPPALSPAAERDRRAALAESENWIVLEDGNPEDRGPVEALFVDTRSEDLRQGAVEVMVDHNAGDWPADHRRRFLAQLAPAALQSAIQNRVPVSVTLAQAILESGWGRSALATEHHNLFGVKAGRSANSVTLPTTEAIAGESRIQRERFRTYENWEASLAHHDALLANDARYEEATGRWTNWREYLAHVAPIYATDPRYPQLVASIVERYQLDRWDHLVVEVSTQD